MENTNKDLIKLPQSVLANIKKAIDNHIKDYPKKHGFEELAVYYATGVISINNMRKIASFYKTFTPSENDNSKEKKGIYDEANIKPWIESQLAHIKRLQQNKVATTSKGSQSGREVDRLSISKTQTDTRPSKIDNDPTGIKEHTNNLSDIYNELVGVKNKNELLIETIQRHRYLSGLDGTENNVNEIALKMKPYIVTYSIGRQRLQTRLNSYNSNDGAIKQRLYLQKPNLKYKDVVILDVRKPNE